jgi:hypothetical protein
MLRPLLWLAVNSNSFLFYIFLFTEWKASHSDGRNSKQHQIKKKIVAVNGTPKS